MHVLSSRTIPSADVVAEILALHDEHLQPGQGAAVRIFLAEVLGDVVAVAIGWEGWSVTIVQTWAGDRAGVAEGHRYVIGRPLKPAEVRLAVDVILSDLWPRLVASMEF